MAETDFTRYAVFLDKVPGREASRETILRHVAHLKALDETGRLVLCGPFTDAPSGLVVIRAKDKAEAEAVAKADPFVSEGVRAFRVCTWLLACAQNGYLA
jgi:uncharacterized protein YciI